MIQGTLLKSGSVLALTVACAIGSAVAAADRNRVDQEQSTRGVLTDVVLAQELFAYGSAARDPLAVITAARIAAGAAPQETARTKDEQGGEMAAAETAPKTNEAGPPELATMLETARDLAGDDARLQDMIKDVAEFSTRGRAEGPLRHRDEVRAQATDIYRDLHFRSGELAEVMVIGDGDTRLELAISDDGDQEICRKIGYANILSCSWVPRFPGAFTIRVANLGRVYNRYDLYTN